MNRVINNKTINDILFKAHNYPTKMHSTYFNTNIYKVINYINELENKLDKINVASQNGEENSEDNND